MANQTVRKKSFWEQYKLPILLLGGIAVGSIIGVVSPSLGQTLKPLGEIFLNLLFTIVVPLVFVSIASAVGSMLNMKRLGKILGSTILVFLVTGAIAGVCVLCWVNLFSPSAGTNIQMGQAEMGEMQSASEMLVNSLTVSDFPELLSRQNMLPLIIFAILFGFCVSACGGDESPVGKLLGNLNQVIMKFVDLIMKIAPIGLGAYFANLIGEFGPELLGDYGRSMVVYYPLCLLYVLIFFPLYALFAGGKTGEKDAQKHLCPGGYRLCHPEFGGHPAGQQRSLRQHRCTQGRERPGSAAGRHSPYGRFRAELHCEDRVPVRRVRNALHRRGYLCNGHRGGGNVRLCAQRCARRRPGGRNADCQPVWLPGRGVPADCHPGLPVRSRRHLPERFRRYPGLHDGGPPGGRQGLAEERRGPQG